MAIHDLKEQISRLPHQPGVYLYASASGDTIYVGKARSLRDRVRSYLGAYGNNPKTDALLDEVVALDVIVTDSVVEALALENNLIKQRFPKYNILLRDDKNYPYLQLTTTEAFPRVLVARQVEKGGDFYAGPFLPAKLARRTMSLTHKVFGIRSCNEVITGWRARACLEYDIGRCLAPCVATLCSEERYRMAVTDARMFLEGRNEELADQLRARMAEAARAERYEEAAQLRDAIRTVEAVRERQQKMATAGLNDRDVVGVKLGAAGAIVQVFVFRGGRVIERFELQTGAGPDHGRRETTLEPGGGGRMPLPPASEAELLEIVLQQLYADNVPPPEIHVTVEPLDREVLETWLSARAGRKVRILVPQRGDKKDMVELAQRNAALAYRSRFETDATAHHDALDMLRGILKLPALPRRIECIDVSTIQGSETVASLVVCEDGRMKRGEYRKFRVRPADLAEGTVPGRGRRPASQEAPDLATGSSRVREEDVAGGTVPEPTVPEPTVPAPAGSESVAAGDRVAAPQPAAARHPAPHDHLRSAPPERFLDDVAAMAQVVRRRYARVLEDGGPFPDLLVIDGGKGQLNAAYAALEALGLQNLVAIGLAKRDELVFVRDSDRPIAMDPHGTALRLLQRIRDEAHRFAVSFHRQARGMRDLRSELDGVPGIGARRRKALLTTFGSLSGVKRATREELTRVVGARAASAIIEYFAHTT
jgi:excinuclease ABC subunit C